MSAVGELALQIGVSRPRLRLGAVIGAHIHVGVYSAFAPPLIRLLQVRLALSDGQAAWILGLGALCSGLCQPLSSWLSDRLDTRIFAPLGLALAAAGMSSIGVAGSPAVLVLAFIIGNLGIGVFNPIGAAVIGRLGEQCSTRGRHLGLTAFFMAGVAGATMGALIAGELAGWPNGMQVLAALMIPGLLVALLLHFAIRSVTHCHQHERAAALPRRERRSRWSMVGVLYVGNMVRFTTHMALVYLFVRWTPLLAAGQSPRASDELLLAAASSITGQLNACNLLGMAVGALLAARFVRHGREKWPLVLVPIAVAPLFALFAWADRWTGCAMAFIVSVGFAAMIPVTISVAQRLLPHRAGLASGLMLGLAWTWSAFVPALINQMIEALGIDATFALVGGYHAFAGLAALLLSRDLLARTARIDAPASPVPELAAFPNI